DQEFSLTTNIKNPIGEMQVDGSKENSLFYDYQKFSFKAHLEEDKLKKRYQQCRTRDSLIFYASRLRMLQNQVEVTRKSLIDDNPDLFFPKVVSAMMQPTVPASIQDSLDMYFYYKKHFFDSFDFSDERLLRTSILKKKLEVYFQKVAYNDKDSLISDVDNILDKAKADSAMFRYSSMFILKLFDFSWGPNADETFIHIVEKYFIENNTYWQDSVFIHRLETRINEIKPTLLGNPGPDLRLENNLGEIISLYQIESDFTVLLFWDTDCDHCKKAIPMLSEATKDFDNKEVTIAAIYIGKEKLEWLQSIEHSQTQHWLNVWDPEKNSHCEELYDVFRTPEIYILNKKHQIVARRIEPENLITSINVLLNHH
ncbi:MAG: hypothetical protein C0594_07215, partial [Marinilabiliales bacterium]